MELGLQGKTAIVTGGSKGIGYATALRLAHEGANVAVIARGKEKLEEAAATIKEQTGKEVLSIATDVSKKENCFNLVKKTADHFGAVDIVVNNAGTSSANPFEEVSNELWQEDLNLKLFAAINCSNAALPYMKEKGGGAILNITGSKLKTAPPSSLPTSVSRNAGMGLTNAMSKDLGKYNIRVNTVCIGLIRSDQIEKKWQKNHPDLSWEEFSKLPEHGIPLQHIGEAEEAANVITFLVSDAASYVTGTSVNVDGGSAPAL